MEVAATPLASPGRRLNERVDVFEVSHSGARPEDVFIEVEADANPFGIHYQISTPCSDVVVRHTRAEEPR